MKKERDTERGKKREEWNVQGIRGEAVSRRKKGQVSGNGRIQDNGIIRRREGAEGEEGGG